MAKKTSVPVAPEAKEVLGAVKTVPTKAHVPGMDGVGAKTVAKQLVKREEEEKEVVSDMDAQAADAVAQEAPVLVAQAAPAPAPTSSDGSAAAAPVQAAASAPAAAAAVSPLWLGVGAIGLAAAAGGGGGDEPAPVPTYKLQASTQSVNEGEKAVFVLTTTHVPNGTQVAYTVRGVSADDISGGQLTGVAVVQNGTASIEINLKADGIADGVDNLVVELDGKSVSATMTVNDTSVPLPVGAISDVDGAEGGAVLENAERGTLVGITAEAVDPNAGDQVSYSLTTNPGNLFAIDATTGVITVNGVIDHELATEYSVTVRAASTDGTIATKTFNIAVGNVNDNPVTAVVDTNEGAANNTVAESLAIGERVGITASASDSDRGATVSYSLVGRDGAAYAGPFTIDAATGVVRLAAALDYESATSHELLIKATSSDGSFNIQSFTVNVTNVNDNDISSITDADPAENEVSELAQVGSVVGLIVAATDNDTGASVTYELVDNAEGRFAIDANTGVITVAGVLDYETSVSHTVVVRASSSDGSAAVEKAFAIDVIDDGVFDFYLTTAIEPTNGTEFDDQIIGGVSDNYSVSGNATTYQSGDVIDGRGGNDTLKLSVTAGAVVDRATVSNVENLELSITADATGGTTSVFMTNWDDSLEKIDIQSSKSFLTIAEQQSLADISIRDLNTSPTAQSQYEFYYSAGVLNSSDDALNLSLDNVNDPDGAKIATSLGIDSVNIDVKDTLGAAFASNVNLEANGAASVEVTGGKQGQSFTLNADVEAGSDFSSGAFVGNMDLTSADIKTATFGMGNDTALIDGQANLSDSSYDLDQGDNEITIGFVSGSDDTTGLNLAGDISAGDGDDTVTVNGGVGSTSSITLNNGDNNVYVTGTFDGDLVTGSGADLVEVASTGASATATIFRSTINVGDGENTVTVTGAHAGDINGGADDDTVAAGSTAAGSTISVGDGTNDVTVTNAHAGMITGGSWINNVTVGETSVGSRIETGDARNDIKVTGDHAGAIELGSFENEVTVGSTKSGSSIDGSNAINDIEVTGDHAGSITTGSGSDFVSVGGNMTNGTINVGGGDGNVVTVTGNVTATVPTSIVFGDGSNNALTIGGSLIGDDVVFGSGSGNEITIGGDVLNGAEISVAGDATDLTIGGDVSDANITLGDGENVAWIKGDVEDGSTITFGDGADDLTLGVGDNSGSPKLRGVDEATQIDMGGDDDQVTMLAKNSGSTTVLVRSGGFMDGNEGDDTLTLKTEETVTNLIARTDNQQVTVDFTGKTFTVDQEVTITFTRGETEFTVSHTVSDADFVQGPDGVPAKVAQALHAKLDHTTPAYDAHFLGAGIEGAKLTITSDAPHEDFTVTSSVGDVDVVQISDTRITNFETLELVALNDADKTDAQNVTIGANFELIDGTDNINLDSQVQRVESTNTTLTNGAYTTYAAGGVTTYNLSNLSGEEAITVAGHEASATGNQQVSSITVGIENDDHLVGDKIIVTIDGTEVTYTVTAADLVAETGQLDANNIAAGLATAIASAASAAGMSLARDANVLTLIGGAGDAVPVNVSHTRVTETTTSSDYAAGGSYNILNALVTETLIAGDKIVVSMGGQPDTEYTVTAQDCDRLNADGIVDFFAGRLDDVMAGFGSLVFDGAATVTVKRMVDLANPDQTVVATTQAATPTDDGETDVVIDTSRAADSSDADMELTIGGHGDFDLSIAGNSDADGFTDLSLTLSDGFDHTVDLNGGTYSLVGAGEDVVQGNFSKSVTIEGGVEGQNIVLNEVLAREVDAEGSTANFTIDQLSVRTGAVGNFAGEEIVVATGTGDDHLRTLAPSALTDNSGSGGQQSSIDLGAGSNTLSLGWGNGVTLGSAELAALGNIDYSGDLTQLNILNAVELANGSATVFRMPGQVTGVDVLTFTDVDVESNGVATLTIEGAASTFRIESGFDLAEDQEDRIVLEVVGVENLSIEVGDEVNVDLNGASLQTLEVVAGDDVDFVMDGSKTGNNNFVNLSSVTLTADDNVDAEISHVRGGATLSVTGDANKGSNGYADVTVSHVTLGDVSVVSTGDGSDFAELNVSNTVGTASSTAAASMGNVTVISNADASLLLENNRDANVNVSGTVDISGLGIDSFGDAARLVVSGNTRTNVSLADGGTIDLVACGPDDDTRVTINNNLNNFLPDFGNPDQTAVTDRSYAINLGAIVADAGEDTIVSLTNNDDTTYYGDLSVTVDRVDLFAYEDASVTIDGNNAATITLGTVDLLSQVDGSLAITNNDGGIYTVTPPGGSTRREVDFADITIGNVTIDADVENRTDTGVQGDASFTVTGNDIARVQVGTVDVDAGGDATFRVDNNDDTTVTTLGVTINAEATVDDTLTFSISDNDRVDNGAETVPPLASSVTINGDVTLTAPSTTTVIDIDGNTGLSDTSRSTVTVNGDFRSTSGNSITASIDGNEFATINLGGSDADAVVNLTSTGDDVVFTIGTNQESTITLSTVTLDAKVDAVLAVTDNISSQVFSVAGRTTLNADDDAQFVIEDNGFGEVRFGDVQINASDDVDGSGGIGDGTVGFDIRDNTGGTNVVGGTRLRDLDPAEYPDLVIGDDGTNTVFYGDWLTLGTPNLAYSLFTGSTFDNSTRAPLDGDLIVLPYTLTSGPRAGQEVFFLLGADGKQQSDALLRSIFATELGVSPDDLAALLGNIQTVSAPMIIETGNVGIDAGGDVDARIRENTDAAVTVGAVDIDSDVNVNFAVADNTDSIVRSGSFDIDALGEATFSVTGNSATSESKDSIVELAVVRNAETGAVTSRGTITINAATVGDYNQLAVEDDGSWGFLVDSTNEDAEIFLGDVSITASDDDTSDLNDVTLGLFTGEDTLVDTGDITVRADNDVYASLGAYAPDSDLRTGDIVISSGNEPLIDAANDGSDDNPNVSSDLYFRAVNLEGNDLNDNTDTGDNGQQITLTANSRGTGEGFVYANIANAPDLTTLTVSGTNAEIYLTGTMGPTDSVQGTFTLDLSGMTGTFDTITTYDPLGASADHNRAQDDGTYVVTVGATFDNDLRDMVVKIGTGDLVYNAQHSAFEGSDTDFVYGYDAVNDESDWGGKEGWFSLGTGLDLSPVRATQVIGNILLGDNWDESGDGGRLGVNELVVNAGQRSYVVTWDGGGNLESDFRVNWNGSTGQSLDWLARELGGSNATVSFTVGGDDDENYVTGTITIQGPSNGYDFADADLITGASLRGLQYFYDDDDGGAWEALNYDETLTPTFTAGDAANDGLGNVASEVFRFTGTGEDMDIGDVVIGGFRPNGFFISGQQDRLDFSAFADIRNADDLIITIEKGGSYVGEEGGTGFTGDANGYFDDVIIDFVNQEYGSIRLVGVGEYFTDANVNGIANSIIFA